jgi:hypothetical protein
MFDLEQAIADWEKQMLAAGIKIPLQLEELEGHLREDIVRQMDSGLDARRAFEISIQQIGKACALDTEFKKNRTSALAEKLMIAVGALFVGSIILLGAAAVFLCYTTWGERVTASTAMLCSLVVACRWRYIVPFLPMIADARKRLAAGLTCIACGFCAPAFILDVVLPHSVENQIPAIAVWTFFLLTTLTCVGIGLSMSERERELKGMKAFPLKSHASVNS